MSGAGHLFDMIGRLKYNNSLLRKPGYFKIKEIYLKVSRKTKINIKHASQQELKAIRNKVIIERRNDLSKSMLVLIVSIIATILLAYFSIIFLNKFIF